MPAVSHNPGSFFTLHLSPPDLLQNICSLLLGAHIAGQSIFPSSQYTQAKVLLLWGCVVTNSANFWINEGEEIKAAPHSCLLAAMRVHSQAFCPLPRLLHTWGCENHSCEECCTVLLSGLMQVQIPGISVGARGWSRAGCEHRRGELQ